MLTTRSFKKNIWWCCCLFKWRINLRHSFTTSIMMVSLSYYTKAWEYLSSVWTCWLGTLSVAQSAICFSFTFAGSPLRVFNVSVMAAAWSLDRQQLWSILVPVKAWKCWHRMKTLLLPLIIKKFYLFQSWFRFRCSELQLLLPHFILADIHKCDTFKMIQFATFRTSVVYLKLLTLLSSSPQS